MAYKHVRLFFLNYENQLAGAQIILLLRFLFLVRACPRSRYSYTEHFKVCDLLLKKKLAEAQFELTDHIRKSQDQASRVTLHQLYARHKPIVFT